MAVCIDQIDVLLHIPALKDISNRCFGNHYLSSSDFLRDSSFCLGAFIDGILVGFALNYCVQKDDLECLIDHFANDNRYHLIKSVAILPQWQRMGIGMDLFKHSLQLAKSKGWNISYGIAWQCGSQIPSLAIFLHFGFEPKKTLTNFWYRDSIERGYQCAICGDPPCCCIAVLFVRESV